MLFRAYGQETLYPDLKAPSYDAERCLKKQELSAGDDDQNEFV